MEEDIIKLESRMGFISKKEIKTKVFSSSTDPGRSFSQSLKALENFCPKFKQAYEPYHRKKLVPVFIVKQFLSHLEIQVEFTR